MSTSMSRPCWKLMRSMGNRMAQQPQMRNMAIMPTVKVASDTSEIDFPAPSHFSMSSHISEIAQNISNFYSNPESTVQLPEHLRVELEEEIERKTKAMLSDIDLVDPSLNVSKVPETSKLGDNPVFHSFRKPKNLD